MPYSSSSSSAKRLPRSTFFRGPKDGSRRVLNRDCMEGEDFIIFLVWPKTSNSLSSVMSAHVALNLVVVTPSTVPLTKLLHCP